MAECVLQCNILDPEIDDGSLVCVDCQKKFVRQLGEIEDYLQWASVERLHRPEQGRSPGFRSSSPAADHVIAMFDRRSNINGGMEDSAPEADYEAQPDHIIPVIDCIVSWARMVVEEANDTDPPETLSAAVRMLRAHVGWMCRQYWVDEAVKELGGIHRALSRAVGDTPDKPIAMCMEVRDKPCEGWVFWQPRKIEAKCQRCGRLYSGLNLARLQASNLGEAG